MNAVTEVVALMRCPRCRSAGLELEGEAARCSGCGAKLTVQDANILVDEGQDTLPEDWAKMQAEAVERYQDEHYEEDETISTLFGGFVAVTLEPDDKVLDIGCGLFPELPAYARHLRMGRYIGLEPITAPVKRSYPCLVGAVAEALPLKDSSIDAALLGTSIDHIADIDTAISELKRVLAPGGRIYFWVGLYEPEIMARSKTFHNILYFGSLPKRIARVALAQVEYGWLLLQMARRRRNLEKGVPIDDLHCRYYTQERLKKALDDWGLEQLRYLLVPGTTSAFVETRPR